MYSSFLQRAYDQVLHDICLQNLHVVIPVDRAGIVGADGETHQGMYDIAFLSHMPNMSILAPSGFKELEEMLEYAVEEHNGPIAVRYPRGNTQAEAVQGKFEFGKAYIMNEGSDITIIAVGRMVSTAEKVLPLLDGISAELINLRTVKPIDETTVTASVKKTGKAVVIEDAAHFGGVGEMVALLLEENGINAKFHSFAFADEPITHGSTAQLDRLYKMDFESIAKHIKEML